MKSCASQQYCYCLNASIDRSAQAAHKKTLTYITQSVACPAVPQPAAPMLPKEFKEQPHLYLEYLNGGLLPYHDRSKPSNFPFMTVARSQQKLTQLQCPLMIVLQQRQLALTVFVSDCNKAT